VNAHAGALSLDDNSRLACQGLGLDRLGRPSQRIEEGNRVRQYA
jgi:hypothetical protein